MPLTRSQKSSELNTVMSDADRSRSISTAFPHQPQVASIRFGVPSSHAPTNAGSAMRRA
jgi:hypothetical protein